MDMFGGRHTSAGQWVAYGPASEIEAAVATQAVVDLVTPDGNVARCTLAHAGRAFTVAGAPAPIAYGYPATTDQEDVA